MSSKVKPTLTSAILAVALVTGGIIPAHAAEGPEVTNGCFDSVPESGTSAPVQICYTAFRPAGADADHPVPVVLHSHGWGGTRTTAAGSFTEYLDAGIGVVSFDQRGHGESTGYAHVQSPAFEGEDLMRLIDMVTALPWVELDAPGDPRLGTIGGSYGGGYQYLAAFEQTRVDGATVIDAMAPNSTWWDLNESLAPSGLTRARWVNILALTGGGNMEPIAGSSLGLAGVSGKWPDGTLPGTTDLHAYVAENGPAWQVAQGRRIDVPVLIGSGTTDNLFPLQQGLAVWDSALTDEARQSSIMIGFNGGHALPSVLPLGVAVQSDPCSVSLGSPDYQSLAVRFMLLHLKGVDTGLSGFGQAHIATANGRCQVVDSVTPTQTVSVPGELKIHPLGGPRSIEIMEGPVTITGRSILRASVTTGIPDVFSFYALAVGTSPSTARIVQNNMIPLRERTAATGVVREFELPSVAIDVPAGQRLYLMGSPGQDLFTGTSTIVTGSTTLRDISVSIPVVTE